VACAVLVTVFWRISCFPYFALAIKKVTCVLFLLFTANKTMYGDCPWTLSFLNCHHTYLLSNIILSVVSISLREGRHLNVL